MLEAALAAVLGLLIGSFLNVCVYRMPRDLSVIRPSRSFCPACERQIAWYDNIPLLSFALLAGRCRHCQVRIPLRYPVVELLTGVLFFTAVWQHGPGWQSARLCTFAALLVGLIFSDLEERILPDEFTLGGAALGFLFSFFAPVGTGLASAVLLSEAGATVQSAFESAIGAVGSAAVIWTVGWLYEKIRHREGLGLGDVKMIGMIGAFLGFQQTLAVLLLGSIAGSVLGVAFILVARKSPATYELPYGTFLGLAAIVYSFFLSQSLRPS